MKLNKFIKIIGVLGIISTGIAGIFFNIYPIISLVILIVGILVAIILYLRTESYLEDNERYNHIIAKQLSIQGLGNPYTIGCFENIFNIPKSKKSKQILRAYEIDQDDESTVSLYCIYKAISLSNIAIQGKKSELEKEVTSLRSLVDEKMSRFPDNGALYYAKGVILDSEDKHHLAREAFRKYGELEGGLFWRISVSISYFIEGLYDQALEELDKAKQEGFKNVNIYLGKVYQEKGEYRKSERYYRNALKDDSSIPGVIRTEAWKVQLLRGLAESLYYQCKIMHSSYVKIKLGIFLLIKLSSSGLFALMSGFLEMFARVLLIFSESLIPLYVRFPILQKLAKIIPPDRFHYLIGISLLEEKQHFQAASHLFKKALEINKKLQWDYPIAYLSLDLGNCYFAQGIFVKETEKLFHQSLENFTKVNDKEGIAKAHWMLSEYYKINNNEEKKNKHMYESLETYRMIGITSEDLEREKESGITVNIERN